MTPEIILFLIIGIVTFDFVLDKILDYLNLRNSKDEIPEVMKDYYDEEKYQKSQEYQRVNSRFSLLTSSISFVVALGLLWFGGFGWLDGQLRSIIESEIVLSLSFFGVLFIVSDILAIPFSLYGTFVIEEKFGFNKTTSKTFVMDKLKGYVLAIILGGGILAL
ncbi:MAG: M48 family peptidase, partial [Cyclobacteriaceae bacterium]|nr:M48 family peptidase [Cyclobacteriaceae bacterium]